MKSFLTGILPDGYNDAIDLEAVDGTHFLFGGLSMVYGVDGSGKSWQTVALLSKVRDVYYLDTDGSNGRLFKEHCDTHSVEYINNRTVMAVDKKSVVLKTFTLVKQICDAYKEAGDIGRPVFVVDSLSSIGEGQEINNAEKIAPLLYKINNLAEDYSCSIILIDHSTENSDLEDGFKLEGNAGAKRRATVSISKYIPIDKKRPNIGGLFKCERIRANSSGIKIGDTIRVFTMNAFDAMKWVIDKNLNECGKSEFTKATQHSKDIWIRDFIPEIFNINTVGEGRTSKTVYKLKDEV